MEKMNLKYIRSDNKPPPYYRCKRCGSPEHYCNSEQCPALKLNCSFCYVRGHLADCCFIKLRKEENDNRRDLPSSSREGQNQQVSKRRIIASQSSSDDEAPVVVMHKRNRESGSNLSQDGSAKPIPKLHNCWIGGESSHLVVSSSYKVNVVSSVLYEKLVASKEFACSCYDKVPGCTSDIYYEGSFEAYIRTAPRNYQRTLFYIQRGSYDFIIITNGLAEKIKCS